MARWYVRGWIVALGLGVGFAEAPARAQVRERDVTITGPRGRTLERKIESRVTPGGIDREMTIRRPGGATLDRQVHISRPPAVMGGGGPRGFGGFGPPVGRNVFVERNVFVNGMGGHHTGLSRDQSFGLGALVGGAIGAGAGLLMGGAASRPAVVAPPMVAGPPVVAAVPQPVYVAAPPPVVVQTPPPVVVQAAPPAPYPATAQVVPPEVAAAMQRLQSAHTNSRLEACVVLGRLGDDRAVPSLIDRLKYDPAKDVRMAAATALGQIGDPGSAVYLERSVVYDKKQDVRDASAAALARLPRPDAAGGQVAQQPGYEVVPPPPTPAVVR